MLRVRFVLVHKNISEIQCYYNSFSEAKALLYFALFHSSSRRICSAETLFQLLQTVLLQVGGIISVIDMPPVDESLWWRGKQGFEVFIKV